MQGALMDGTPKNVAKAMGSETFIGHITDGSHRRRTSYHTIKLANDGSCGMTALQALKATPDVLHPQAQGCEHLNWSWLFMAEANSTMAWP